MSMKEDGPDYNKNAGSRLNESNNNDTEDELRITPGTREYIIGLAGHQCENCGADDEDFEIDHIKPKSEGGSNHISNLQVLCRSCHLDKHSGSGSGPSSDSPDADPLPPHTDPNDAHIEVMDILRERGPADATTISEESSYSYTYVRRLLWTLAGEQLVAKLPTGNRWDLAERVDSDGLSLPATPGKAARAGRDEVIRKMAASGLTQAEIANITGLSRSTVITAIQRARALRIDIDEDTDVDLSLIAQQVSATLSLIDQVDSVDNMAAD